MYICIYRGAKWDCTTTGELPGDGTYPVAFYRRIQSLKLFAGVSDELQTLFQLQDVIRNYTEACTIVVYTSTLSSFTECFSVIQVHYTQVPSDPVKVAKRDAAAEYQNVSSSATDIKRRVGVSVNSDTTASFNLIDLNYDTVNKREAGVINIYSKTGSSGPFSGTLNVDCTSCYVGFTVGVRFTLKAGAGVRGCGWFCLEPYAEVNRISLELFGDFRSNVCL